MSNKIRVVHSSNIHNTGGVDDSISTYKEVNTGLKVLIVDDDKSSGESLRDMIRYRGHDVTLLDEGMKFVNRMNEEEFDIIFMDYHTNDLKELDDDFGSYGIDKVDQKWIPNKNRIINMLGDESIESTDNIIDVDINNVNDSISDDMDRVNETEAIVEVVDNSDSSENSSKDGENDEDEITGTYITKLARECYDFETPVFAYTGDNSTEAIEDFKDSNFKGVFVKPVDISLINTFFDIIEKEYDKLESLVKLSANGNAKLRRLGTKNKNFIFFHSKRPKVSKTKE